MKGYKRLTERENDCVKYAKSLTSNYIGAIYEEQKERDSEIINRLAELEDKIESGELCDRKETAREILKPLYNVIMEHSDCCVNLSEDIKFLMEKYGIDLENEE